MSTVSMEEIRREIKKRELKDKAVSKLCDVRDWVVANKNAIITLTPVVIGGITTMTKVIGYFI